MSLQSMVVRTTFAFALVAAAALVTTAGAQACRGRNSFDQGFLRVGAEQLSKDGETMGTAYVGAMGSPRKGPFFEIGLGQNKGSSEFSTTSGVMGWQFQSAGSNLAICPYAGLQHVTGQDEDTKAAGIQAGYEMKLGPSSSLVPNATYHTNFQGDATSSSYILGVTLNMKKLSIIAAQEQSTESGSKPTLRLGASLNLGGRK